MLATLVVLSVIFFAINFVMDRYFIDNVHRQVKLGILSMLFWLAGAAAGAAAFVNAIHTLGV